MNLDDILANKDTSMSSQVLDALFENLLVNAVKKFRVRFFLPHTIQGNQKRHLMILSEIA